ncbi:hypothetical protein R3P38DRAFT_2757490 [Favolaschia claudopus]|uniref:Uncharacterized protein n=1 Tax=Favolaschia claudopus TaxID=2862362 RepID=A0AAW0ELH9_9AGAR
MPQNNGDKSLSDRTNTAPSGRQSGRPPTKTSQNANLSSGRDNADDALQQAIPGAKVTKKAKKRAPAAPGAEDGAAATPENIARLEAQLAQLKAIQSGAPAAPAASKAPAAVPRTPAPPAREQRTRTESSPHSQPERAEKLKMIPEPSQETPTQIGMGLARTDEGKALYLAAQETVRDCIKRADMDLALTWKRQPLEKKLLVINSAKKKIVYLQRMEGDWATERLGVQALKNRRVRAYKQNTLPRPAGYEHLKINASKRSASGSRVPKAKLYLEDRRARKARERERERESREMVEPPRKRARVENRQPEFVQGSSRDMHPVGNEWDAHPEIDEDYVPGQEDGFGDSEDERNADPGADDEEEEEEETF